MDRSYGSLIGSEEHSEQLINNDDATYVPCNGSEQCQKKTPPSVPGLREIDRLRREFFALKQEVSFLKEKVSDYEQTKLEKGLSLMEHLGDTMKEVEILHNEVPNLNEAEQTVNQTRDFLMSTENKSLQDIEELKERIYKLEKKQVVNFIGERKNSLETSVKFATESNQKANTIPIHNSTSDEGFCTGASTSNPNI